MPVSCNTKSQGKKLGLNVLGKSGAVHAEADQEDNQFFTIAPALPILPGAPVPSKLTKRTFNSSNSSGSTFNFEDAEVGGCDVVALQQAGEGRTVVATRTSTEREKNPDRICLDRRGLTRFPEIINEPKLRLMSLQHNLIARIEGEHFAQLTKLVFLDLYDNQIEKICDLGTLENLRVLLVGKNRIKKIEGLEPLTKLEVLDLHGNQIVQISGLDQLESLKVLNLAGNNVKTVGFNDFHGLTSLRELNLKRNKIKKLLGFGQTPQLQKLYLSNNDIQKIEDMGSLAKALQIKEISIDGNPVTLNTDCVSFLVSYLPNLQVLSTMQVNEQVRRAAMAWRTTKEQSNSAFLDLSTQVCVNVRREEVITNAKTNWELLRSQTKCFTGNSSIKISGGIKNERIRGLHLENSSKFETVKFRGLTDAKSKGFGSLTSINENVEARKIQFKKRSNSSDGLFRLDSMNKVNALNFKLPPILVPIINNLTNARINDNSHNSQNLLNLQNSRGNGIVAESTETTTDSDLESSESHESLKSGLRSHLIKTNNTNRRSSIDTDDKNNLYNICNSMVGPTLSLFKRLDVDNRATVERNSRSFLSPDFSSNGKASPIGQRISFPDTKNGHRRDSSETGLKNPHFVQTDFQLVTRFDNNSVVDSNKSTGFCDSSSSSTTKADEYEDSEDDKSRVRSANVKKIVHYKSNRAATARAKHRAVATPTPPPRPNPPKEKEQGGDYLVEIVGRCLNVYGQGALRFVDRPWDTSKATDVNIVKFNYVQFNGIATVLSKLKNRFPNAEHFIFKETNISHLGQINALAEAQGLTSIQVEPEGNPIISKDWRAYAIFRLAHWGLKVINGREITDRDIESANEEYSGLTDIVMWSLPETLLQPLLQRLHLEKAQKLNGEQITAKQFLFNSDPALRNVVAKEALQLRRGSVTQEDLISRHKGKLHLSGMIDQTVDAVQKLQILENEWPNVLFDIIRDTLIDYAHMDVYMKRCSDVLDIDKVDSAIRDEPRKRFFDS